MTITRIAILPPLAFARFGSHPEPVDSYTLESPKADDDPLGYRRIVPEPTFQVSADGEITGEKTPETIIFKQDGKVRPVAPFFELWGELDDGRFVHLDQDMLRKAKLEWRIEVENRKVFRRTNNELDKVKAETKWFSDHAVQKLEGTCKNFVADASIDFGEVRYIKPNKKYPHIRLRFTPAAGRIYGPEQPPDHQLDETFLAARVYKYSGEDAKPKSKAKDEFKSWVLWEHEGGEAKEHDIDTVPPDLFAIIPPAPPWLKQKKAQSRGYFDDACDGFVRAKLTISGKTLRAKARIGVAPPHYAPDTLFVRNLLDDLEQAREGVEIAGDSRERALEVVRRAFETVRFMNVAVMNGNPFRGRDGIDLDTMPAEEAFGNQRPLRPVFSPPAADTHAIMALHQRVFAAVTSGSVAWFAKLLRQPEEVADLTDDGRRKMPALMCGADSNYLALTRRQIKAIEKIGPPKMAASKDVPSSSSEAPPASKDNSRQGAKQEPPPPLQTIDADRLVRLRPVNKSAELLYKAAGNPISSHPITAIGNCCPGLEFDFRAVWRRLFAGITLVEHDNLVVDADPEFRQLRGRRLLMIDGHKVVTRIKGPKTSNPIGSAVETNEDNPQGVICMEWSNSLARVLTDKAGEKVTCVFSDEKWGPRTALRKYPEGDPDEDSEETENPEYQVKTIERQLKIRNFFEDGSAVVSETLAEAGELTQGLCSPWQNDFRECSCYYWASSRPDYVNVTIGPDGTSRGDNWLQKERTGDYLPDDYQDSRLIMYDDLFKEWERILKFQVGGRDYKPDDSELPKKK
ncbi:hypothetical protein [Bradyrhizobium iriomotense]|uniref:Uncharacterized protein n=1 Tax=Bradyrhizobium iriomotense TaxID=441950 RepID=A0ABQ6AMP6_9BRAD|nr:hypothetical protein [Bradyrhizobium iriomotense]GLR83339.1 hypothetical protein GCM10007857_00490 [Bradyrhizobium iriomotense]